MKQINNSACEKVCGGASMLERLQSNAQRPTPTSVSVTPSVNTSAAEEKAYYYRLYNA